MRVVGYRAQSVLLRTCRVLDLSRRLTPVQVRILPRELIDLFRLFAIDLFIYLGLYQRRRGGYERARA